MNRAAFSKFSAALVAVLASAAVAGVRFLEQNVRALAFGAGLLIMARGLQEAWPPLALIVPGALIVAVALVGVVREGAQSTPQPPAVPTAPARRER